MSTKRKHSLAYWISHGPKKPTKELKIIDFKLLQSIFKKTKRRKYTLFWTGTPAGFAKFKAALKAIENKKP